MSNYGSQLASETIGSRIKFNWLGVTRSIDDDQQERVAALFGSDADAVSTKKKLLNTRCPEYKAVGAVRTAARKYWFQSTLPFTEPGVRLLRRTSAETFNSEVEGFQTQLSIAVESLNSVYGELLDESRTKLGDLFDPANYPASLTNEFKIRVDFPNLSPPDYLAQLSPQLYEREVARVQSQFDAAVSLAEASFAEELQKITASIVEKLSGQRDDGKPQIFHDSLVGNLRGFFGRFRELNIGGNDQLQSLIDQAEQASQGVTPKTLRNDATARQEFRDRIAVISEAVNTQLETGTIARPVRKLRIGGRKPAAE